MHIHHEHHRRSTMDVVNHVWAPHHRPLSGTAPSTLADRGVHAWNGAAMVLPAGGAGSILQAKLQVNRPGDRYEQEADRVADAVVGGTRTPMAGISALDDGTAQRKCAECEQEEEHAAQRKESGGGGTGVNAAAAVEHGTSGGGEVIPAGERDVMEAHIGADFGGVRIHRDGAAASAAQALNARAFTVGRDVVFGAGEYQPGTHTGRHLLAHELTHVVQQRKGGRVVMRQTKGHGSPQAASMVPPGDCTWGEHRTLQNEVNNACKRPRKCTQKDDCPTLLQRIEDNADCIRARVHINAKCFKGGDQVHRDQVDDAIATGITCHLQYDARCRPKAPPVAVPVPAPRVVPRPVTSPGFVEKISIATGLTGLALWTYIIISEGSRLYPPRNLVPIP